MHDYSVCLCVIVYLILLLDNIDVRKFCKPVKKNALRVALRKITIFHSFSQRKLSTFQSRQYCLAVNETLLSAFRRQHCPNVCSKMEINVPFLHKSKLGGGGNNIG